MANTKEAAHLSGWLVALQGILAIIFGFVILTWPGITVAVMIYAFAFFTFIQSFVDLGYGISYRNTDPAWWTHIVTAILGFIFGVVILVYPAMTALTLVYLIAIWAMVIGMVKIVTGLVDKKNWSGKIVSTIVGVLYIMFGIFVFTDPLQGAVVMVKSIALFYIMIGVITFILAFQVKNIEGEDVVAVEAKK